MQRLSAVLVAALMLLPQAGSAEGFLSTMAQYKAGNLKTGKLALRPRVSINEKYDSNIYLVPRDKVGPVTVGGGVVSSWITDFNAGLGLGLTLSPIHKFLADYNFQTLAYDKQPRSNDAVNQTGDISYNYTGPTGLTGRLWDTYVNTEDPAFSELVTRERRWQNNFGAMGEYQLPGGKMFAGLSFDQTNHKYLARGIGGTLNRYEQTYGARLGYKVQPKTRLYGSYKRKITHYSVLGNPRNSKTHMADAGLEGQISPKVTGKVETGVSSRDYDDANANRTGNSLNWQVSSSLKWKANERCSASVYASRGIQESTFDRNRFYISTSLGLDIGHQFGRGVSANVGASLTNDKYPEASGTGGFTATRHDQTYKFNMGADYAMKSWLVFGANYEFKERNSVFTGQFNYERHLSQATIKLLF